MAVQKIFSNSTTALAAEPISVLAIVSGDIAEVYLESGTYFYEYDSTSSTADNHPYIVKPTSVSTGRWVLISKTNQAKPVNLISNAEFKVCAAGKLTAYGPSITISSMATAGQLTSVGHGLTVGTMVQLGTGGPVFEIIKVNSPDVFTIDDPYTHPTLQPNSWHNYGSVHLSGGKFYECIGGGISGGDGGPPAVNDTSYWTDRLTAVCQPVTVQEKIPGYFTAFYSTGCALHRWQGQIGTKIRTKTGVMAVMNSASQANFYLKRVGFLTSASSANLNWYDYDTLAKFDSIAVYGSVYVNCPTGMTASLCFRTDLDPEVVVDTVTGGATPTRIHGSFTASEGISQFEYYVKFTGHAGGDEAFLCEPMLSQTDWIGADDFSPIRGEIIDLESNTYSWTLFRAPFNFSVNFDKLLKTNFLSIPRLTSFQIARGIKEVELHHYMDMQNQANFTGMCTWQICASPAYAIFFTSSVNNMIVQSVRADLHARGHSFLQGQRRWYSCYMNEDIIGFQYSPGIGAAVVGHDITAGTPRCGATMQTTTPGFVSGVATVTHPKSTEGVATFLKPGDRILHNGNLKEIAFIDNDNGTSADITLTDTSYSDSTVPIYVNDHDFVSWGICASKVVLY